METTVPTLATFLRRMLVTFLTSRSLYLKEYSLSQSDSVWPKRGVMLDAAVQASEMPLNSSFKPKPLRGPVNLGVRPHWRDQ